MNHSDTLLLAVSKQLLKIIIEIMHGVSNNNPSDPLVHKTNSSMFDFERNLDQLYKKSKEPTYRRTTHL